MSCRQCGSCCKVIAVNYTKKEFKKKQVKDLLFFLENWRRISRSQALEWNPLIEVIPGRFFYTCLLLDWESNKCMRYKDRPSTCSRFPFYGEKPDWSRIAYLPECGYRTV